MRYVPVHRIQEGMILGRPIYGAKYEVLLGEGMTLSNVHIQRINRLGYAGIYILDNLSSGIEVRDLLPTELRLNTIRTAKESWQAAEEQAKRKSAAKTVRGKPDRIIMPVIESLISNHNRIVDVIDLKPEEDYLYYHEASVVILSLLIGVELGLSGVQLYELGLSALFHDVGNIFIPKAILEKPGKLTPEEFDVIKSHTEKGFDYLRNNFDISIEGCMGALQHHENYDGSGYPTGLKRDKISIYGRIIAITDVYDALTSRRPFREMMYPVKAMEYLDQKAGTLFDPDILRTFQQVVPHYPTGVCVELDSGVRGIVVRNYAGAPDRPCVRLLNNNLEQHCYLDLNKDERYRENHITRIIEY